MKVREIASLAEIDELERAVVSSAQASANAIRGILEGSAGIQLLAHLKFDQVGVDPLADRPLNLIEQVNQTFTYLASCEALRFLFEHHPDCAPFKVHLGTASGPDIVSRDGALVAEVFAATRPTSNSKLRKDVRKLSDSTAALRYVFYSCPEHGAGIVSGTDAHVRVVSLGLWIETRRQATTG